VASGFVCIPGGGIREVRLKAATSMPSCAHVLCGYSVGCAWPHEGGKKMRDASFQEASIPIMSTT